jgi:hypothetical protein
MAMARFEREDDPGFLAVAGQLSRWCKTLTQLKLSDSRAMQQEQQERPSNSELRSTATSIGHIQNTGGNFPNQGGQQNFYKDININ